MQTDKHITTNLIKYIISHISSLFKCLFELIWVWACFEWSYWADVIFKTNTSIQSRTTFYCDKFIINTA